MPGRPRLTEDDLRSRVAAYCARYGVTAGADGLPPFPAGRRESRQHRDWLAVYKLHHRLARRGRGQCERCSAPAADGSVFCEAHRAGGATREDRQRLLQARRGRCPICGEKADLRDPVDYDSAGRPRGVLHVRCAQLVGLVGPAGPGILERLRRYLWPGATRGSA